MHTNARGSLSGTAGIALLPDFLQSVHRAIVQKGQLMLNLTGKRHVVFGVANKDSICWAIAQALAACGSEVTLVSHPMNEKRVRALVTENGLPPPVFCEVDYAQSTHSVEECFADLPSNIDGLVHGIAFSNKDELMGEFTETSAANFANTLLISCYSFIDIARCARRRMRSGGSMISLSFDASRGTYPNYNVMGVAKAALETTTRYLARDLGADGIRVNVLSPSPENTISARGISNFRRIGDFAEAMSPLGRRATLEEVANSALYLLSDMSAGVTGQVHLVDCGASSTIMPPPRNAEKMATNMWDIAEIYRKEKGTSNDA